MFDQSDLDNAALCVWKEARGEGIAGMRAVAHVIFNRIGCVGFPHTLHEVIYQRNAFTSMSVSSDPEFNLEPGAGDQSNDYAKRIVAAVAAKADADPTFGAHYYANLKNSSSGWFVRNVVQNPVAHPHTVKIGSQDFYV